MIKKKTHNKKGIEDFDVKINESGEVEYSISIDEVNEFLDKNVSDKKLHSNKKKVEMKKDQ